MSSILSGNYLLKKMSIVFLVPLLPINPLAPVIRVFKSFLFEFVFRRNVVER